MQIFELFFDEDGEDQIGEAIDYYLMESEDEEDFDVGEAFDRSYGKKVESRENFKRKIQENSEENDAIEVPKKDLEMIHKFIELTMVSDEAFNEDAFTDDELDELATLQIRAYNRLSKMLGKMKPKSAIM